MAKMLAYDPNKSPRGSKVLATREQVAAIPCYFSQNLEVRILAKMTWDVNGSYMFANC